MSAGDLYCFIVRLSSETKLSINKEINLHIQLLSSSFTDRPLVKAEPSECMATSGGQIRILACSSTTM